MCRPVLAVLLVCLLVVPGASAAEAPRDLRQPAAYHLSAAAGPVRIGSVSDAGEVGVYVEHAGVRVVVESPHVEAPLLVVSGPQSGEVVLAGRDVPRHGPVVVTVEDDGAGGGATARLRWEDPRWFAGAPSVGEVVAVLAVGLLLVLHHGRSPRRYG